VQQSLNDAAGTGKARHQDFEQQDTAYHAAFRAYYALLVYWQTGFRGQDQRGILNFGYQQPSTLLFTPGNWQHPIVPDGDHRGKRSAGDYAGAAGPLGV
jgi:hypothetical protein